MKSKAQATDNGVMKNLVGASLESSLQEKFLELRKLFHDMGAVLVAFSGGIDSTLVLKLAHDTLGSRAIAVTAVSPTFPEVELDTVRQLSQEIGARLIITETNQLQMPHFVRNDGMRCYHCKTDLYHLLGDIQKDLDIPNVVDGTNRDDLSDERPGIKAAREFSVRSPLVEASMGKADIRTLAKALGLSNWDKPAAACLSSRIPRGIMITHEKLRRVEKAEAFLLDEGFRQVRVRDHEGLARIELDSEDLSAFLDPDRRQRVTQALKNAGFRRVTLDLEGYRQGGGNAK
ncbi:MAG: ATP-dependent sacrificial sulfur transferase LarE [Nitrospirae bacterium]|nr:ATP-dependent sacrificial sulfur transferase LarE [Nitrospirota bacterium]